MPPQIDQLQAKIQQKILQATFLKNMACLQLNMPSVHEYFKNYQPQKAQLAFDADNNVNLIANDCFVYEGDPKTLSVEQVGKFLKNPPCFEFEIPVRDNENYKYKHEKVINELYQKRRELLGLNSPFYMEENGQINFIAVMGIGLGYHVEELFSLFSIRSIFIFEPEPDVFYAALHCIDISEWFKCCIQLGGELTLKIGGGESEFVNEISHYFKREGFFNLPQMYLYRHYISDKTTDAFKLISELEYRYKSGWGFCEDEIIGISHTLSNISDNKAATLLDNAKLHKKELPVFIIGNGPSLDNNLAYIKENQNNVIIISSGTSLKPLLNYGIIPDMHVEQERPKSIYHWVKQIGHQDILKQIPLLCLNTVYPGILALFKRPYIMLKAGDAGTSFIHEHISAKYSELYFCNPTVTNASTAGALAMGFENLYLFGLDYGFKSEDSHHAQGSIYQDIKGFKMKGHFKVPGNFGGEVYTTRVFDSSRGVLEMLLEQNPNVKCINASDGAAIKLTSPERTYNFPKFSPIKNKKQTIESYLTNCFNNSYSFKHDLYAEFSNVIPDFESYITLLIQTISRVKTKNELTNAFTVQFKFITEYGNDKNKLLFHRFFIGSINYLQAGIMNNVARYKNQQEQQDYIQFCIVKMQQHLLFLLQDVTEHYNKEARA